MLSSEPKASDPKKKYNQEKTVKRNNSGILRRESITVIEAPMYVQFVLIISEDNVRGIDQRLSERI